METASLFVTFLNLSMRVEQHATIPVPQASENTQRSLDYDLAIVGGGLVGLALACALKPSDLRVLVIEAKPDSAAVARGQAYHINLLASRIFQGMGVWDRIRPLVNPIEQIRLSDANYPNVVQFFVKDLATDELGYVAEHRVLLDALREFVQQCPNVTYLCPAELTQVEYHPDRVDLALNIAGEQRQVQSRLLVAADGARSPIRQQAGITTDGWQYWQSCVVAFIKPEKSHQNIAYERFQPDGPFAILPLPDNICRIVWTAPKAAAEAIVALEEAEFLAALQQRYGDQMGQLSLVGDRYVFPVQLMQSRRYTLPRLALIGDAAHCCHPVGGQGVNMGFRDAAALAEVLQQAHQEGEDIGSLKVLRQYDRWRRSENWIILGFTDLLNRMFSNTFLPIVVLRRLGLAMLNTIRPIRLLALRLMVGLTGRTPKLAQQ
ncbi:FAD-dependent hydroxylase [Pantanalinema rosaneae CENA516]|uniref:FAD-dependent hydroxylase n=1 Tax=Pantanalinema rosaneae TaxID=1620701 RepID=UPI003D6FC8F8